jgi:ribosomal-protein-alanine N-acetyltransferase
LDERIEAWDDPIDAVLMNAVVKPQNSGIRLMAYGDLPEVIRIESNAYDFPWSKDIFRDCLRVGYSCWIYEANNAIKAYGIMSIGARECHVLNLCVKREEQGQGLGRMVLRRLMSIAYQYPVDIALLEVRPSNWRAMELYLTEGFNEVGRRKAYYPTRHGREDALILAKPLSMLSQ